MQEVIDSLFRRLDHGIGSDVAALPEPLAHLAAFLVVMFCLVVGLLAVGGCAMGLARITDGPAWSKGHSTFEDMHRSCLHIARLHWWLARPEALLSRSIGLGAPRTEIRLPDARSPWLRLFLIGEKTVATALRVLSFVATPTPATLFAWVLVIAYLDPELVRQLAPDTLPETITDNWSKLPGVITVAGTALGIAAAIRRSRMRAFAAHRLASEQRCLAALSQIVQHLRVIRSELWNAGTDRVHVLEVELMEIVDRVSRGRCRLNERGSVGFVRGSRYVPPIAVHESEQETPALKRAVRALELQHQSLERRGELMTLYRLIGDAASMRSTPLAHPSWLMRSLLDVSRASIANLADRQFGIREAHRMFALACDEPEAKVKQQLELRGAVELELAIREIARRYRRELATLARHAAETNELEFRLRRRLRVRYVDRLFAR